MLRRSSGLILAVAVALVLVPGPGASAAEPTEQLRGAVDRVITILEDPNLHKESKTTERRAALRKVASDVFDFGEMSKRALARHWQVRTPAEREEFTQLFADLLERSYVSKIELYRGEKVSYVGDSIDGDHAIVRTRITTKQGQEVPVDYRTYRSGDRWMVYDVVIEGVSLVANYRTQFNTIIQRSSYRDLVTRLKAKEAVLPAGAADKRTAIDTRTR